MYYERKKKNNNKDLRIDDGHIALYLQLQPAHYTVGSLSSYFIIQVCVAHFTCDRLIIILTDSTYSF